MRKIRILYFGLRLSFVLTVLTFFALLIYMPYSQECYFPLSVRIAPEESIRVEEVLKSGGISPLEYNDGLETFMVPVGLQNKAMVVLAKNGVLAEQNEYFFEEFVMNKKFSEGCNSYELREALQKAVQEMLHSFNGVKDARVLFTSLERKPLFRRPYRQKASVKITMEEGKILTRSEARAMIKLVAFCRAGLDEKNVVVVDQDYNYFSIVPVVNKTPEVIQAGDTDFR